MKKTETKTNRAAERLMTGIGGIGDRWILDADDPNVLREAAAAERARKKNRSAFVGYELKKLLGVKYLWVFLFVLLLINSALAWNTAGKTPAAQEPADLIAAFFDAYSEDPAEIDAHYAEIQAFEEEQNRLFMEAIHNGNYDFEPETMSNLYSDDETYPDARLFDKLYSALRAAEDYPELLDAVIERAEKNLSSLSYMGISGDSFTSRYQRRVIGLYEELRDTVTIRAEYTRGWEEYFSYHTVDIFVFFMLVMLGSLMFAQEKQSGFLPVLRTAKNGRAKTAAAKVLTMLLLSCVFTLLFTVTTFAVFGLRLGYSSPANALQSLSVFTYSPERITIGTYFLYTIGLKLLTFAVFSLVLLVLSVLFYNYVLIYLAGLGVFGISFVLYSIRYVDANNLFRNLNFVTSAAVLPLFERYRALNFFGAVIGFVPAMLVLFPCLLLLCAGLTVFFFARGTNGIRIGWLDGVAAFFMTAAAKVRRAFAGIAEKAGRRPSKTRTYSSSLILAECYKTLISSRFWVLVLAILCVKVWYSARIHEPSKSYADAVYREYMTELEGELTEDKLAYLADERASITDTLSRQKTMQEAYLNDEISFEEYHDYLSEYNYAYSRDELLRVIEDHAAYLRNKEAETGVRGWFVYDTGWKKLYQGDADLFLYVSLLLLFVGSFAAEYVSKSSSGGFAQVLRSTKNGRHKTFSAKLVSSGTIAMMLAILTVTVDIVTVFRGYEMPAWDAPLCSIETFSAVSGIVTVGQYLCLFVLLRLAAALLLTFLICALSELLARYIPVLGCAVILTLLPALCAYFGFAAAEKISFLNLLAGTPLFLQSAQRALFGNGYAMLTLWLVAAMAAVWAMMVPAKKMFVK